MKKCLAIFNRYWLISVKHWLISVKHWLIFLKGGDIMEKTINIFPLEKSYSGDQAIKQKLHHAGAINIL